MGKAKAILLATTVTLVLIIIGFFILGSFRAQGAGIFIETDPASAVYIDGELVGRTPYRATRAAGEIVLKLIPEATEVALAPFETRVVLSPGIETVVKREFGESEDTSSGEIISFEKVGGRETALSIVSIPESAQIALNGQVRGFAPLKMDVSPGEHLLTITMPGTFERTVSLKTVAGYKLTTIVYLAPNHEAAQEAEVEPEELTEREMVEIETTPTGFLRVRSEPSTSAAEVAQVRPGEKYLLLETDEATGWYKIEYEDEKEGWVSNQYSKIIVE